MAVVYIHCTNTSPNCMSSDPAVGLTQIKALFSMNQMLCVPCLTGVQSWDQEWALMLITLLIWWVGPVCKLRMLNACHLVSCKDGLVVDVVSIAMIVMAMEGFLSSWLNWISTKTMNLLKDQIQIEAIEKSLEEDEQDGGLKEKQKGCF